MRICIAISVAVHAAILLWLVLARGGAPFDPAEAQPILVELLQPQEAPREAEQEPRKPDEPKQKTSAEQPKSNKTNDNLTAEVIAAFKTQVSKCWSTPDGVPDDVDILVRVAFKPDGKLSVAPELIRAPASLAGPPLVASAKRALQQCQPYTMLPADKYQDWRVLDLTFTADGPAGLTKASRRSAATP